MLRHRDGALWIGHVKRPGGVKLPASVAFAAEAAKRRSALRRGCAMPPTGELRLPRGGQPSGCCPSTSTTARWPPTSAGASSTPSVARARPTRVLVLEGGRTSGPTAST